MSDAIIPASKPLIGQEERAAVDAVLQSGMLAQGSEVSDFETEFGAALAPGYHTVATNAGRRHRPFFHFRRHRELGGFDWRYSGFRRYRS